MYNYKIIGTNLSGPPIQRLTNISLTQTSQLSTPDRNSSFHGVSTPMPKDRGYLSSSAIKKQSKSSGVKIKSEKRESKMDGKLKLNSNAFGSVFGDKKRKHDYWGNFRTDFFKDPRVIAPSHFYARVEEN